MFSAIIAGLSTAILLAACGNTTQTANSGNQTAPPNSSAANANVTAKAFRVDYSSEPGQIQSGQSAMLVFTVKDDRGAIVKDLQTVHEKLMHLLIVSKDLAEFYHLHPEQQTDGSFRVSHVFPNGGAYKLYADFTPKESAQVVEQVDISVSGAERSSVPLQPDEKFEKTVDNLRVVMKPSAELRAGQELTLDFQAFDAASGKPATDLQNYLGELAHFVIISEDMKDFVHAHPMGKGERMDDMRMDGDEHPSGGHDHSTMEGTTKPSASEVAAHTMFPRSGLYKVWAQFQRNNKVISVAFIVRVL